MKRLGSDSKVYSEDEVPLPRAICACTHLLRRTLARTRHPRLPSAPSAPFLQVKFHVTTILKAVQYMHHKNSVPPALPPPTRPPPSSLPSLHPCTP